MSKVISKIKKEFLAVIPPTLGKSVLIADMLPINNRLPERPLVYNVVWKTVMYCTGHELVRVIGKEKGIFFGPLPLPPV
jgi:hypothetical protein